MLNYYAIYNMVTIAVMIVMVIIIKANQRLDLKRRVRFHMTYLVIFAAMIGEWVGIMLNGAEVWTVFVHKLAKCMDYSMTPLAGLMVIWAVAQNKKLLKIVRYLLVGNILLQILSIFTGWTFYVDASNIYHHGPLYPVYMVVYGITLLCVLLEFYLYGRKFSKQNRTSLFAIMVFMLLMIVMQEVLNYKIIYLMLAVAASMLYLHYCEFAGIEDAADLMRHKEMLDHDVLTGLCSRYAYNNALKELEEVETLPKDLVVFSMDVNELKIVNDTLGHLAGDELLQGASACIQTVLGNYGKCYRVGGDEFIGFLHMDGGKAFALQGQLVAESERWQGSIVKSLTLSVGYAVAKEHPKAMIDHLIALADEKMYEAKAQFYMQHGKNRRKVDNRRDQMIEQKQQEYIDIISAFASDTTGLYVIDRTKKEVTAYRLSASDHHLRSGVPLKQGFDAAMRLFVDKHVHPDDKETMQQSIQQEFIERELERKQSFVYHFRTLSNGELQYHYMKCIRNSESNDYDKIIISFCPEDKISPRKKMQEFLKIGENVNTYTVLLVGTKESEMQCLCQILQEEHNCIWASDGEQAITFLQANHEVISAIFYQRDLESMNAVQFLDNIRNNVFLASIPVVVVAEQQSPTIDPLCLERGVVDFVNHMDNPLVLKNRMNNVLKMNQVMDSIDEIEIDALTGLYTKEAFLYHARTLIDANPDEQFTVVICDILNFKLYNSINGTRRGDELLVLLAEYLGRVVSNGITARYGADQFISIVKMPEKEINFYINKVQEYLYQQGIENVVLKFGIYENVDRNVEVVRMCDRALTALKSIKNNYNKSYATFDGPVSQQQLKAHMFESKFRKSLDNGEFVVWFQPKYSPYTEKVIGAEALVRWCQDGRMISPGEFLPVFESDGLIAKLDEYVFRVVCEQQKKWKGFGKPLIPISVNLSRFSMHQSDVVKRYKEILDEYELDPSVIPIEITESAAIGNVEIKPLADAFYEAGFVLHMDDFGSGKSSIAGLTMLHFDTVKLDKSLINQIAEENGRLVLMYTVALGKELGLRLVAEGVETKEQVEYLKDIGCEGVQGYFYCKPVPVEEFEREVTHNIDFLEAKYDYRDKLTAADSVVKRAMDRMLQRMPGGFLTYRYDDSCILSSNSYLWRLFGCESEEEFMTYVGGTFHGMVCPEDQDLVEKYINRQIAGSEYDMDYVEYHIQKKDGTKVAVVDYGHLDRQPDGDIFYVFISEKNQQQ